MVVVALGEPGWPVTCCADSGVTANAQTNMMPNCVKTSILYGCGFMQLALLG